MAIREIPWTSNFECQNSISSWVSSSPNHRRKSGFRLLRIPKMKEFTVGLRIFYSSKLMGCGLVTSAKRDGWSFSGAWEMSPEKGNISCPFVFFRWSFENNSVWLFCGVHSFFSLQLEKNYSVFFEHHFQAFLFNCTILSTPILTQRFVAFFKTSLSEAFFLPGRTKERSLAQRLECLCLC